MYYLIQLHLIGLKENPLRIFLLIHIQSGSLRFMSHLAPYEDTENIWNMTEEVSKTSLTKTHSAERIKGKKRFAAQRKKIRYCLPKYEVAL